MKKAILILPIALFSFCFAQDEDLDLDMDAMWDNTVWNEIEEVTTKEYEVEKVPVFVAQKQKMKHCTIFITANP